MNELKYIIVIPKGMNHFGERAIIFNGAVTHSSIVPEGFRVVSAGFMRMMNRGEVQTWGKSESLGVESRPEDNIVVLRTLYCQHTATDISAYG